MNFSTKALASAATIALALVVMPKPATLPENISPEQAVSVNGGESVTVPLSSLSFERPSVDTTPAPAIQAVTQAPVIVSVPVTDPIPVTQAPPLVSPVTETPDEPVVWVPEDEVIPVSDPTCEEMGYVTAEDLSCVNPSYYEDEAYVSDAEVWAMSTLEGAGLSTDHAEWLFTNTANCGAELSDFGAGGCTYETSSGYTVVLSPELAWSQSGTHILFHEYAHTLGIWDECEAETFAHQFEDPSDLVWSYPSCMTTD